MNAFTRWSAATAALVFIAPLARAVPPEIQFDGESYRLASFRKIENVSQAEYFRNGESPSSWTQTVTFQQHDGAHRIADVVNPYMKQRHPFLVLDAEVLQKEDSPHAEDITIILVLKYRNESDGNDYVEYVLYRVFSDPAKPVGVYAFVKRLPFAEQIDFTEIMKKRSRWIAELGALEPPR